MIDYTLCLIFHQTVNIVLTASDSASESPATTAQFLKYRHTSSTLMEASGISQKLKFNTCDRANEL